LLPKAAEDDTKEYLSAMRRHFFMPEHFYGLNGLSKQKNRSLREADEW
jgi:hypothetical protein